MKEKKMTRRQFLTTTAAATVAMSVGPWVKTSHSAGKLSVFLWDHWIPGANDVSRKIIMDWGKANGVDVTVDYVTSRGDKNLITHFFYVRFKSFFISRVTTKKTYKNKDGR